MADVPGFRGVFTRFPAVRALATVWGKEEFEDRQGQTPNGHIWGFRPGA